MANNIFKAIKNAGSAFFDAFNNVPINNPSLDDSQLATTSEDEKEGLLIKEDADKTDTVVDTTILDKSRKKDESEDNQDSKVISKLDNPEIRLKTAEELSSGGYILGFSMQGRSHIMNNIPCQDYHAFEDLGDGWLLAITSDGAGSAREAARGSKANCELAMRLVKQLLDEKKWKETDYFPDEKEWYIEIKNVFEVMQAIIMRSAASQVEKYKEEQEKALKILEEDYNQAQDDKKTTLQKQIEDLKENMKYPLEPRDFNATIILLLVSPQGMMAAHIGDGRMGYLSQDGIWKPLITPHKGDEASSTVFIPNNWNRQLNVPAFTMSDAYLPDTCVIKESPKAFVLMSDGCESFSWTCKVYDKEQNFYFDKNEPYERFFTPLIEQLNSIKDKDEKISEMIDIVNIGTVGGKRELDDRTMLLGVLS